MCVSAVDFVGKSHEELILMLIQLRRRQSELCKSCEQLRLQMESEEKMMEIEPHRRDEYNYRFQELQQKLNEVEKEYEFQIPIIESIDSMIKIKSKSKQEKMDKKKAASTSFLDKVARDPQPYTSCGQFEEEKCEKNTVESVTTASTPGTPNENIENLKKQQRVLENELDRVRGMLTHSTKKLEEKAVENAQMEQEMLIARNKLKQVLDNEQEAMELTRSSKLEAELTQINKVIDDLHYRRKELNSAIENLKHSEVSGTGSYFANPLSKFQLNYDDFDLMLADDIYKETVNKFPLYENLTTAQRMMKSPETELSNKKKKSVFDQVNNNLNETENDEFFTLNINLNKSKPYSLKSNADPSEINNNEQNIMCEFDPTKVMPLAYGDSIVDQQIKQIYNYQTYSSSQKSNEIRTVREVKRESERRKFYNQQQQQNCKLFDRKLANYDGSYYLMANHYYKDDVADTGGPPIDQIQDPIEDFDDLLQTAYDGGQFSNQVRVENSSKEQKI